MPVCGTYESAGSSATWTIEGLDDPAKFELKPVHDGTIRTYDSQKQLFYVHFKQQGDRIDELENELKNFNSKDKWDSSADIMALYKTEQAVVRVCVAKRSTDSIEVFEVDSGKTLQHVHLKNLFKMPPSLRKFEPQVVPVAFPPYSDSDLLTSADCLKGAYVTIQLEEDSAGTSFLAKDMIVFPDDDSQQSLEKTLKDHKEFKKYSMNKDAELTCCFQDKGVCPSRPTYFTPYPAPTIAPARPKVVDDGGLDHTLLTCIIVGSVVCAIIIVLFAAFYLYRRFGHVISERHRREHHGHRRHRNGSQPNSDPASPPSSQKREPLPVPEESGAAPSVPSPVPPTDENVINRLPQYSIVSKDTPHCNYSQVNRNISPMMMENATINSPNRAMTPVKTAEMSTQTCSSVSRSNEPVHDDDAASNRAQPSGSRMSAGSGSSDLSDATLRQLSHHSIQSRNFTRQSICPPSLVTSSGFVMPSPPPASPLYRSRHSPAADVTSRTTHDDYLSTTGATMADDVLDSDDEDEDSITRSVDDCERVLAAYKPPSLPAAHAPGSAHRTTSHLSTRPQFSSTPSHYTENESNRDGEQAAPNRATRPHLISLPHRSPHGEEKRGQVVDGREPRPIDSKLSVPSDLFTPRTRSTNSDLHTAARRESTVSWLADSTQLSMGRSMHDDEFSL